MRDKWDIPDAVDGYDTICMTFEIPDVDEYRRAFYGALEALTTADFWQSDDSARRGAAATYWSNLLHFQGFGDCADGGGGGDAPYWDDEDTLQGEGEGERWGYTEAADWVVGAFLATTVHPAAGLFYKTVIPRGRIAFKSHDFGGLARILIDGIFAIDVDTASAVAGVEEIIEVDIDLIQFALDHTLSGIERLIEIVKVG